MSSFGEKIRALRQERYFSQQKVANDLKMSQSAIAAYENSVNEPNFRTIQIFADYYHVSPHSLLPFETANPDEEVTALAEAIQRNPKLKVLFDRTSTMQDSDLEAVLGVVRAISRERDANA